MENKRQHWVPSSYLAAWVDTSAEPGLEPYVWVFPRNGGEGRRKAPKNIFHETDMYTIVDPSGRRDLRLEHGLGDLETQFARLRRERLSAKESLESAEHLLICAFVAAAHSRTRLQRDHLSSQWKGVLEDMEAIEKAMQSKSPREREEIARLSGAMRPNGPSLGIDEVRQLSETPLQVSLLPLIATQVPLLMQMDLAVFSTEDETGFITSDAPCVWFDPEAHARPFPCNSVGLAWPTIEITLPLSPSQLLLLNRSGLNGYYTLKPTLLSEINRRTRGFCGESFVVRRNQTEAHWFLESSPGPRAPEP